MPMKEIKQLLTKLSSDYAFRRQFACINDKDAFLCAKRQEQLLIDNSDGFLCRLNNAHNSFRNFDPELDLKFGDMVDINGVYYDLKVGIKYTGAISQRSIENFGDTSTNLHWYICTNKNFSRFYLLNAATLAKMPLQYRYNSAKRTQYIGELDYKSLTF